MRLRFYLLSSLAQFPEQPRVLYGDGRLVCKGTDQFDLPLSEWLVRPEVPNSSNKPLRSGQRKQRLRLSQIARVNRLIEHS